MFTKIYNEITSEMSIRERMKGFMRLKLCLNNVLCNYAQFCTVCLSKDQLLPLSELVNINYWEGSFHTSLSHILDTINCEKEFDVLSESICEQCRDKAIHAYSFIYNSQRSKELLHNYIQQINDCIDDLHGTEEASTFTDCSETYLVLQDPYSIISNEEKIEIESEEESLDACSKEGSIYNESKVFICNYCNKAFNSKQSIAYHIRQMHLKTKRNTKKYLCCECDEDKCKHHKYLTAYKEQILTKNETISCPDCDYACYSKVDLITHVNKVHLKIFSSMCEYCGKPLHSKKQYKIHLSRYHTDTFSCEFCDHKFKVEKNLLKHKRKCMKMVRCYKCDLCPASFNTSKKLNFHRARHEPKYPCNLCNKVFARQRLLDQHETLTHTISLINRVNVNIFPCLICHEKFSTVKGRKQHMAQHGANEKYRCSICDTEHATLKDYNIHKRNPKHLLKVNPEMRYKHKCVQCNYSSISEQLLEAHINRYHLKMAPYECKKCPRKFLTAKRLETHSQLHDSSKKVEYFCEICGNTFRSSTALLMHKRRHTGERPYQCDVCGECFVNASSRSVHKLKVHCYRQFKCPLCEYMAPTLPYMRCHFRRVHWKRKGETFDVRKVEGLSEEDYELFRDRRLLKL